MSADFNRRTSWMVRFLTNCKRKIGALKDVPSKGAFELLGMMPCASERDALGRKLVVPLQGLAVLPEGSAIGSMQALCPLSGSGNPNRSFHGCGQGSQ